MMINLWLAMSQYEPQWLISTWPPPANQPDLLLSKLRTGIVRSTVNCLQLTSFSLWQLIHIMGRWTLRTGSENFCTFGRVGRPAWWSLFISTNQCVDTTISRYLFHETFSVEDGIDSTRHIAIPACFYFLVFYSGDLQAYYLEFKNNTTTTTNNNNNKKKKALTAGRVIHYSNNLAGQEFLAGCYLFTVSTSDFFSATCGHLNQGRVQR